jgi:alkylhydroperoxidase family enzyme
MQARMQNPATLLPDALEHGQGLAKVAFQSGVDQETLSLVHLRASQINGCSWCVDSDRPGPDTDEKTMQRKWSVSAWREAPYYTDAQRAALELAEAMTRQADKGDVVTDELWTELTAHYDDKQVAGLVFWIATVNFYNRVNAAVRQVAGTKWN